MKPDPGESWDDFVQRREDLRQFLCLRSDYVRGIVDREDKAQKKLLASCIMKDQKGGIIRITPRTDGARKWIERRFGTSLTFVRVEAPQGGWVLEARAQLTPPPDLSTSPPIE